MAALKPLWLSLGEIAGRFRATDSLHVACDFDGTLAPIAEHPEQAALPPRARDVLSELVRLSNVRVAVLSGRSLDDLERRVPIDGLFLAGIAGIETRDPSGRRSIRLEPEQLIPGDLREELSQWCARFNGAWLEDKRFSYALHYRAVPAALQAAFCAGVRRRLRPRADRAQLVHGKKVFEILPLAAGGRDAALRHWMPQRGDGLSLFFGDDTQDEALHGMVRDWGGIAVTVGRKASRAEYVVPSPIDVVWFLEWLGREWAQR